MVPAKKCSLNKRLVFLFIFGILVVWIVLQIDIEENSLEGDVVEPHFQPTEMTLKVSEFMINTKGCRIPAMEPFDSSIKQFVFEDDPIICETEKYPPIVNSNVTHVYLDAGAISAFNLTNLTCCYTPFWRVEADESEVVDGVAYRDIDTYFRYHNNCIEFEDAEKIENYEFIRVTCTSENRTFVDYHSFTPLKDHMKRKKKDIEPDHLNVMIIGVDAVSRLNLHRQMPVTLDYLKSKLNVVEMFGYNKVADNTFPNLVPVLSGLTEQELGETCWPTPKSTFDNCQFLWKNFSDSGYITCFAEDASWMGIFNYLKFSFWKQPTDYYWRVFNKKAEDEIGHQKRMNANLCIGRRLTAEVLLDYAEKFYISTIGNRSFSLIWGSSLSHDFLNLPKFGDEYYRGFLERLASKGVFNTSVLVFMSDHGIRWGDIRNTYQGHLEERLPCLYFSFPEWFRKKYAVAIRNLKYNSRRLTTPFDLHETLLHLLHPDQLTEKSLRRRIDHLRNDVVKPRGISLFLPISPERTCAEAGVTEHWCSCHQTESAALNDTTVVAASNSVVTYMNGLIQQFKQCAKLQLHRVMSARLERTLPHIKNSDQGVQDYIVTLEVRPGGGTFEATVRHGSNNTFNLMGTVSRTNTYGKHKSCMDNYHLELYCYCL
ncbi:uncharacterized protein LOC111043330 [Nilaparvata lugens]|uniref:uncharacterized protein LOC111043330 n=1 Tax=Nilaparvata lugens TaxID=108931 RepID=UPI00193D9CA0|nr:uncharacterized protein LOC111043330 [Nilaparvata lugens]XP_022183937.2 uncharacterized protein LOC111043330 [Nilaparvata lugens]XP_039280894.1 uncharacterized protein LOC111043330 [Nilaparvata lugens]